MRLPYTFYKRLVFLLVVLATIDVVVTSFGGFSSVKAQTTEPYRLYIPMAFRGVANPAPNTRGTYFTDYTSSITIHNRSNNKQQITMLIYDSRGDDAHMKHSYWFDANSSSSVLLSSLMTHLDKSFQGGIVLEGKEPFTAAMVGVPPSNDLAQNRPVVNAQTVEASKIFFPSIARNDWARYTKFNIQNTTQNSDTLSFTFYHSDGSSLCSVSDYPISDKAVLHFNIFNLPKEFAGCNFPANWRGSLTVSSPNKTLRIVGSAMEVHNGWARVSAYNATPFEGSTYIALPSVLCKAYGTSSLHGILNTSDQPLSLNVELKGAASTTTGVKAASITKTLPINPHARLAYNPCPDVGNTSFFGSAVITANGPIAILSKVGRDDGNPNFEGASEGIPLTGATDNISLPYIRWTSAVSNTRPRTHTAIQNLSNQAVPISMEYYDRTGTLRGTHNLGVVAPFAKVNSDPSKVGLTEFGYDPSGSGGSAVVKGPQGSKLIALVRVQGVDTAEDYTIPQAIYAPEFPVLDKICKWGTVGGGTSGPFRVLAGQAIDVTLFSAGTGFQASVKERGGEGGSSYVPPGKSHTWHFTRFGQDPLPWELWSDIPANLPGFKASYNIKSYRCDGEW